MNTPLADMRIRLLILATRKLLDKFKNLKDAATFCRVKPTNLSQYQSFEHSAFMPVDVVMALESVAGEPFVSGEMARLHETGEMARTHGEVRDEALDVPVAVGELLAFICEATANPSPGGRQLTEFEKRRYFDLRQRVREELDQLDAAVESEGVLRLSPSKAAV